MSLLIKGADMPKSCAECWGCVSDCGEDNEGFYLLCDCEIGNQIFHGEMTAADFPKESRHKSCPLVEIPSTHGRLIDADRLMNSLLDMWSSKPTLSFVDAIKEIGGSPTVIEAEE